MSILGNPLTLGGAVHIDSIYVSTPPDTTTYEWGDTFDPTGMVVSAVFPSGDEIGISEYTYDTSALELGDTSVTISFTFDGDTFTCTQAITVTKKTPTITLGSTTATIYAGNTATITVSTDSDGSVSVSSGNTDAATATISGSRVVLTGVAAGLSTVTVSTAATTNYFAATATIAVTCTYDPELNNNSWSVISAVSIAGTGDTYWDLGDKKAVTLNGDIGDKFTASSLALYVFILDFNHADGGTSDTNIIWGGFMTSAGVKVALIDSYYESTSGDSPQPAIFNMKHTFSSYANNTGGWKSCDMRYDILGSCASAGADATSAEISSPVSDTLMAALPSDFRNVLRLRTHYVDNVGGGSSSAANVTSVVDCVSLMSQYESFGSISLSNEYEADYQTQFAYFTSGASHAYYKYNDTSTTCECWNSSPSSGDSSRYLCFKSGSMSAWYSAYSLGLAPVFKT